MRSDTVHSGASTGNAQEGLFSHDGVRLPAQRIMHDAAADVEEGLEFWKTIAGNIPSRRRSSREFLNRKG